MPKVLATSSICNGVGEISPELMWTGGAHSTRGKRGLFPKVEGRPRTFPKGPSEGILACFYTLLKGHHQQGHLRRLSLPKAEGHP